MNIATSITPVSSGGATELAYFVGGLDCAGCARKIEGVANALPGASDITVNFTTQALKLRLDEQRTDREVLEMNLRDLGYTPELRSARIIAPAVPEMLSYVVGGLDCAGCARKIEGVANALPGASDITVNFTTQILQLRLDPSQTRREVLEKTLRDLGYQPELTGASMSAPVALTYRVGGVDCAGCARKIEGMADGLPGASNARVNFTTQVLTLLLDETKTPRARLEQNLRDLGYDPSVVEAGAARAGAAEAHDHAGHVHNDAHPHGPVPATSLAGGWRLDRHWTHILVTGFLIAIAFALSFWREDIGTYGYMLATAVGVVPPARKAFILAKFGEYFSINMLMSLAAVGAVAIGEAQEGAIVVVLFLLGEVLEGFAARKARQGIKALAALAPKTALLVSGGDIAEVAATSLAIGQTVQVNPGGRVPADGTILEGSSSLDDSPVTGESVPVFKQAGDSVYAGSINTSGTLRIRVDRAASDNTIARIIHMVEEAEAGKAPTARFIDRFSRVYTPIVVAIAALTVLVPPLLFGGLWHDWLYKGLALLLIGCPCALIISVPAAITSGLSSGTRRGLLVKGGAALETIGSVRTIAFDKTGTLTAGRPVVTEITSGDTDRRTLLALAAAVERGSSHPLAKAIVAAAVADGVNIPGVSEAGAIPGKSVHGRVDGRMVHVSSPAHAATTVSPGRTMREAIAAAEASGHTAVVVHDGTEALGVIALRDQPREDAAAGVAALKAMGITPVMLTGDNARTGQAIASAIGLGVQSELLPEHKLAAIDRLKAGGKVAMVGDGINDAPALARADVGIAMGGGTDVALETADAALMGERVTGVAELVQLSRDTMSNIHTNIAIALGLKGLFLITTLTGTTNLWMAIFADTGATALVTMNAIRLLRWTPRGLTT